MPRQFLGVGASVAAVAAAIALALTSGGGQHIPAVAAPAPPPVVKPVKPPAPAKPAPNKPAPPPPTSPPTSQPPKQQAPTTPAPPPPPGQPTLTASGPSSTVVLTPGGGPVDVPITVRNSGASPSQPVSAALNLPPGVTAVGSGQHFGAARPLVLDAPSTTAATSQVDCPGGSGTVTCTSPSGLQPGQSVVLLFVLEADQSAQDGQITGTVMAGGSLTVRVTVQVHVPPLRDALTLRASADESWPWLVWPFDPEPALDMTVTNTGASTRTITLDLDRPGTLSRAYPQATCIGGGQSTHCQSDETIAPHGTLHVRVRLYALRHVDQVRVTAMLGSASQSATVELKTCSWWVWPLPGPPSDQPPTTPPTTTAPPTGSPTTLPGEPILPTPQIGHNPPPTHTRPPGQPPDTTAKSPITAPTTTTQPTPSAPPTTDPSDPGEAPGCPGIFSGGGHNQPGIGLCLPGIGEI